jgi:hypothetical protein
MSKSFFDERRSDDRERFVAFPVGNVFPLKKEKWESKHVVSVHMGDENGAKVGDAYPSAAKPGEGGWWGINDVALVHHGKGVMAPVREECIPRSQHVDAWAHDAGMVCAFLFPSVIPVRSRDVNRYQG